MTACGCGGNCDCGGCGDGPAVAPRRRNSSFVLTCYVEIWCQCGHEYTRDLQQLEADTNTLKCANCGEEVELTFIAKFPVVT